MATYMFSKKDVKQFRGHMTSTVKFIYDNFKDSVRFRSVHGETGNISRINIRGKRKSAVYATVGAADKYKALVDANPRATLAELVELAEQGNSSEVIEIAKYFLENQYKEMVPVIELDTDIKKEWKPSEFI